MMMLASTSLLAIFCGVFCITDSEMAWQFYEWDCRMINVAPPRLRDRLARVRQVGYALIAAGSLGIMLSLGM